MRARAVLDPSAALRAVLKLEHANAVLDYLEDTALVLVPSLFASEVANGLWKYVRHGSLSVEQAQVALERALDFTDTWIPEHELAREALSLAAAHRHPVYDTLYAVVARRHGCSVATFDNRLIRLLDELDVGVFSPGPR